MNYDREALLAINDSYKDDTRLFLRFLEERELDMSVESLAAYVNHLRENGYAAQTINKRIAGAKNRLRRVFRLAPESIDMLTAFGFEEELKDVKRSSKATKEVPEEQLLSIDDIKKLLASDAVSDRWRVMIRFFVTTGLRVSELTAIRVKDCLRMPTHWRVRIHGKGRKERMVMVPLKLMESVRKTFAGVTHLFETQGGQPYDRVNVSSAIGRVSRAVLGKRVSAHTLRHTFATHSIKTGKSVKAVSVYLGHSTTAITQDMYVHDRLDLEDIDLELEET